MPKPQALCGVSHVTYSQVSRLFRLLSALVQQIVMWAWRKGFIIKPPQHTVLRDTILLIILDFPASVFLLRQTFKREETNFLSLYFQTLRFTNHRDPATQGTKYFAFKK